MPVYTANVERLSHAYIVNRPVRETNREIARAAAAAVMCTSAGTRPCGICPACRKVFSGNHPDVIWIGREKDKKEIGVAPAKALATDALVLPNEAPRKVYIIDEADLMNVKAQNAILKVLEEPPAHVVFLLCAVNIESLLPTVRSRCADIFSVMKVSGEEETEASAWEEDTMALVTEYLHICRGGDALKMIAWCAANENMGVKPALEFAECLQNVLGENITGRRSDAGLPQQELWRLYALAEQIAKYLRQNTGSKNIFGLLMVESIPVQE